MKTISDLQDAMYNHDDVGIAMQVQSAIGALIDVREMAETDGLTSDALKKIRAQIYANNRKPNPVDLLFGAIVGKTGNPIEAALQYVEHLIRQK